MRRLSLLAILIASSAVGADKPVDVPAHTPSELLQRVGAEGQLSCDTGAVGIFRTPGFNPAAEDKLTAQIGPAYNAVLRCYIYVVIMPPAEKLTGAAPVRLSRGS